jgi:hypothetical protein
LALDLRPPLDVDETVPEVFFHLRSTFIGETFERGQNLRLLPVIVTSFEGEQGNTLYRFRDTKVTLDEVKSSSLACFGIRR